MTNELSEGKPVVGCSWCDGPIYEAFLCANCIGSKIYRGTTDTGAIMKSEEEE